MGFLVHYEDVFNMRPFDLSLATGCPPLLSLILHYVMQHRSLTAIGQKKTGSHSLIFTRDTCNRDREKSSDQNQLSNIWTKVHMNRTSGQPQVKLSLLRSISFKIRPQAKTQKIPLLSWTRLLWIKSRRCSGEWRARRTGGGGWWAEPETATRRRGAPPTGPRCSYHPAGSQSSGGRRQTWIIKAWVAITLKVVFALVFLSIHLDLFLDDWKDFNNLHSFRWKTRLFLKRFKF